jgi:hypothetical protein
MTGTPSCGARSLSSRAQQPVCRLRPPHWTPRLTSLFSAELKRMDEFTFCFNRRRTPMAAFQRVLGLGSQQGPTTHEEILAEGPGAARRAAELNG